MEKQKLPNSKAVMILGIISIISCCCFSGVVGIILGIVALILAKKDIKLYIANPDNYDGYSNIKIGRTLAIIGTVVSSIYLMLTIFLYATIGEQGIKDMVDNLKEKIKYQQELNQ